MALHNGDHSLSSEESNALRDSQRQLPESSDVASAGSGSWDNTWYQTIQGEGQQQTTSNVMQDGANWEATNQQQKKTTASVIQDSANSEATNQQQKKTTASVTQDSGANWEAALQQQQQTIAALQNSGAHWRATIQRQQETIAALQDVDDSFAD